jgi:hypothetical protein
MARNGDGLCQRAESGTSTREITGDGFLLIGDAGLAYHQSGEQW